VPRKPAQREAIGAAPRLYYGDNLDSFRKHIPDESVDLCYIDPPFNSKRTYNQIYNRIGAEDRAQAQAFTDTWTWDEEANIGLEEIIVNGEGRFPVQTVELIKGLVNVLGKDSLLAYLISITLRLVEIHRVLKPTGSFYLHCDPTASHYLKIVLDGIFCSQGGEFVNEIIWCYSQGGKSKRHFGRKHDVLFWFSKNKDYAFYPDSVRLPLTPHKQDPTGKNFGGRMGMDENGREYVEKWGTGKKKLYRYYLDHGKLPEDWWIDINSIQADANERLGYPTQKPEALLERIIEATTEEGHMVLDAYCGCGTTIAVAQRLHRSWIGMDITFQSVSLVLKRLEDTFGKTVADEVKLTGVPRDMESAIALAHKKDDRLRKEFEKWAVLTYTMNRAVINEKKGADAGIDGTVYFLSSPTESDKMVFQVKSGKVGRGDIAKLNSDRQREGAALATLITLEESTSGMCSEAKGLGNYKHQLTGQNHAVVQIITVKEIIEGHKRLDLPLSVEALKAAPKQPPKSEQQELWKRTRESGD
jgi:site-specific DNA-methyltransferase (adenine-specific)